MIGRQIALAERLLKFQMGLDLEAKLILSDSIKGLINGFDNNNILLQNYTVENSVEFKLVDTQAKLMKMNLLLNKSNFLPDIAGFYQHEQIYNTKSLNFNPPNIIGISASVPLFTSGSRIVKVGQARIAYEKALNSKQQAADGLKMSYEETKSSYLSAIDKYKMASENLKLSEKIYYKSLIKKKEGIISSAELTQVQNQYFQSQSNYFSSIIDIASTKAKLEKILTSVQ
jgi:outer membrane protein TolC